MKCYHILFTKDGLIYNIGFFIIIPIIILKLLSIIHFYKKDFPKIKFIIIQIINTKKYLKNKSFNNKNKFHKNQKCKNEIKQINHLEKKKLTKIPNKAKGQNNLLKKKNKMKKAKRIKKSNKSNKRNRNKINNINNNLINEKEEHIKQNKSDKINLKNSIQNKNLKIEKLDKKAENDLKRKKRNINSPPIKISQRNKRKKNPSLIY